MRALPCTLGNPAPGPSPIDQEQWFCQHLLLLQLILCREGDHHEPPHCTSDKQGEARAEGEPDRLVRVVELCGHAGVHQDHTHKSPIAQHHGDATSPPAPPPREMTENDFHFQHRKDAHREEDVVGEAVIEWMREQEDDPTQRRNQEPHDGGGDSPVSGQPAESRIVAGGQEIKLGEKHAAPEGQQRDRQHWARDLVHAVEESNRQRLLRHVLHGPTTSRRRSRQNSEHRHAGRNDPKQKNLVRPQLPVRERLLTDLCHAHRNSLDSLDRTRSH
mmetsp:Transcript_20230/g.56095  ORF Transcript_20230/g.56095 Transcript_20230/m.56095 type:complete len:274 (-) Transcript_20230:1861-2682(-)